LAITSSKMKTKCLPKFAENGIFHLENAIHPCLMESMPNVDWVANSIRFDKNVDALLLTGPNMSGKSTLLRLSAVSVILAQVGCYVPADRFTLAPVDRIFCRIGASDRLLEGKSTFFIEMEETKTILDQCTHQSLVIVDELGRGTSTYDGVAIASAVLRYLVTVPLPKAIFATHYHILLDEFALHRNIMKCVMKHYYDETTEEVKFTYLLVEGEAEKSFATNVARIAGLPKELIRRASDVERKITKEEEKLTVNRKIVQ
jgi:DNA mismatch repair ATPase MutS